MRHRYNYYPNTNNSFTVLVYYDGLTVELGDEHLIYDISRFLSSLGGSLGLFLGFSCLGILMSAIQKLRNFVEEKKPLSQIHALA